MNTPTIRHIHPSYTSWRAPLALLLIFSINWLELDPDIKRYISVAAAMFGLSHSVKLRGMLLLLACMFDNLIEFAAYLLFLFSHILDLVPDWLLVTIAPLRDFFSEILATIFFVVIFLVLGFIISSPVSIPLVYYTEKTLIEHSHYGRITSKVVASIVIIAVLVGSFALIFSAPQQIGMLGSFIMHPFRLAYVASYKYREIVAESYTECDVIPKPSSVLLANITINPVGNREVEFVFDLIFGSTKIGYRLAYDGPLLLTKTTDRNCFASAAVQRRLPEILRDSRLRFGMYVPYIPSR